MPFIPNSEEFGADKLISEFKSLDRLEEQIKYVLLQLYSLDKDSQAKFRNQIIECEKLLTNQNFMRQIKYRDSLVIEYSTEYFGSDFGDDDPFIYNTKLEADIIKIGMRLLATVGLIAKSMKERNIFVGDEA